MKDLISAKDIEEHIKTEEKVMVVGTDAIVTPFANDVAKNNGIRIVKKDNQKEKNGSNTVPISEVVNQEELIMKVLKIIFKNDWQAKINDRDNGIVEKTENGFKLIKGKTMVMSKMDEGLIEGNAYAVDFYLDNDKSHEATLMNLEDAVFSREKLYNEANYVIGGKVDLRIEDKTFSIYAGDVFYIPKECKTEWQCYGQVAVFSVQCW